MSGSGQSVDASKEPHLPALREGLPVGRPVKHRQHRGGGFFDPDRALRDCVSRQLLLACQSGEILLDRSEIEIILAVAEDRFELFLLHAALLTGLRVRPFALQLAEPEKASSNQPAVATSQLWRATRLRLRY